MSVEHIDIERAVELIGSPSAPAILVLLCDTEGAAALRGRLGAQPTRLPLSWVSLRADGEDADGFVRRLLETLEIPEPPRESIERSAVDLIGGTLNMFLESTTARVVVIEGIESVSSVEGRSTISYLLEFLPDPLRVVLLSVLIPPIGIPRLVVRRRAQLFVLDAHA